MLAAEEEGVDRLVQEAYRRAVEGVEVPIFQKGTCVGTARQFSDRLLEALLRARAPGFSERIVTHRGAVAIDGDPIRKLFESVKAMGRHQPRPVLDVQVSAPAPAAPVPAVRGPAMLEDTKR